MFELNKDSKIRNLAESVLDNMDISSVSSFIEDYGEERDLLKLKQILKKD